MGRVQHTDVMEQARGSHATSEPKQGRHCAPSPGITGIQRPRGAPAGAPAGHASAPKRPETSATLAQPGADGPRPAVGGAADPGRPARTLHARGGQALVWREEGDDGAPRLVREGRVTLPAAWDHPHLVSIVGPALQDEGLVMELVPGGSLAGLVQARGTLPIGEAVTLLVPLARALAHLHAAGVSHGDVAPQNIMFRADSSPVLIDPGSVRLPGQAPSPGGTEGFGAGAEEPGPAADVFGWGAVAWWVLTGETPGPASHRVPLVMLRRDLAPATARLIEDCIDADPRVRPPAAELAGELLAGERPRPLDASAAVTAAGSPHMLTQAPPPRGLRLAWQRLRDAVAARFARPGRRRGGRWGVSWHRRAADRAASSSERRVRPPRPGEARWRPSRWWFLPALLLSVAAAGIGLWRLSAQPAAPAPSATLRTVPAELSPGAAVGALPALDRDRTRALRERDEDGLGLVYVPGSAGLAADGATIRALLETGQRFEGIGSRVESLHVLRSDGSDVVVRGRAVQAAYRVVGTGGARRAQTPVAASTAVLVWTLRHTGEGWRILEVGVAAGGG